MSILLQANVDVSLLAFFTGLQNFQMYKNRRWYKLQEGIRERQTCDKHVIKLDSYFSVLCMYR